MLRKTLSACVCAVFSVAPSLRAADLNTPDSMAAAPPRRHWIAHTTTATTTSCLAYQEDQATAAPGEESHLEIEVMSATVGRVSRAGERNSHIFDFAIMGNHLLIRNHVWFYDLSLYCLMLFIFLHKGPVKRFEKTPTVCVS